MDIVIPGDFVDFRVLIQNKARILESNLRTIWSNIQFNSYQQNYPNLLDKVQNWIENIDPLKVATLTGAIKLLVGDSSPKYYIQPKKKQRKDFSESVKRETLQRQNYRCNSCLLFTQYPEYHHKDRNPENNNSSNCEMLCPLCHAKKNRNPKNYFL